MHLLSYFDTTVTCLEAGVGKIEPDVYLEAMKRIGTTLENTWVFEDAYHALHTAKKAGFHTVALDVANAIAMSFSFNFRKKFSTLAFAGILSL